jgi:Tfp pilus assembly major pilin PilA
MSMKLAPKPTAVVVAVVAVAVAVVAVAVVVVAAAVVTAAVVVVGTNNPVLLKKLDARYYSFNNSGLKESRHRITLPFCLTKKAKKRSYRYTFKQIVLLQFFAFIKSSYCIASKYSSGNIV